MHWIKNRSEQLILGVVVGGSYFKRGRAAMGTRPNQGNRMGLRGQTSLRDGPAVTRDRGMNAPAMFMPSLRDVVSTSVRDVLFDNPQSGIAGEIRAMEFREFAREPQTDGSHLCELVDVRSTKAVVRFPEGRQLPVPRDPR